MLLWIMPSLADVLLSPSEEVQSRKKYEKGLSKCPKDKPLYDGENCYSCDEPKSLHGGRGMKCSEICPNRYSRYECGPSCILKNPPTENYAYVQCQGWIKKCSKGLFQDREDGKCYSCKDLKFERGLNITEEECLSCPDTQYVWGECYPQCPDNRPLLVDGRCESCDLKERSGYVHAGCEKCANRVQLNDGCYLKCPSDKPLLGLDTGKCFSCSDEQFKMNSTWQPRDYMVWGCLKCLNEISKVRCMDKEGE